MKLSIDLNDEEVVILEKRAKKNLMSIEEMAKDIVRRSCVNYKGKKTVREIKCDDNLVGAFSRQNTGRKPKKKVRK